MSTTYYRKVRRHLSTNCPVMKSVIARVGPCTLVPKGWDDPFTLLVRCVIAQQISTKAAESIFWRLAAAVNGRPVPPRDDVALAMWQRSLAGGQPLDEAMKSVAEFKKHLILEVEPGGWVPTSEAGPGAKRRRKK